MHPTDQNARQPPAAAGSRSPLPGSPRAASAVFSENGMTDARLGQGRPVAPAILAITCLYGALAALSPLARAESLHTIVVTATRTPEPEGPLPIDISVVSAKTIGDLDAHDMASALSLVPGVEAPPGGDAGPSSAVPAFWGLHEFDAFLLVVDGVPWGGAFNPGITTLDFNNVQRVEVLKGPAPVLYGATSFVGVVQVISYPAGEAANAADLAFGSYGSWRGSASLA